MIDHVGLEVSDLARSAAFYDAIFAKLGGRRIIDGEHAIAYGVHEPKLWIVARGRAMDGDRSQFGHVALHAHGRAAVIAAHDAALAQGGRDDGAPGPRPNYGPRYFAAYLLDPDGTRVELVSGSNAA